MQKQDIRLGITNCFAVKRWTEPDEWARIIRDELQLDAVQLSLDLLAPDRLGSDLNRGLIVEQATAAWDAGLDVHSIFTGLASYSSNLLLHPNPEVRDYAEQYYQEFIDLGHSIGVRSVGGHFGAYTVETFAGEGRQELYDEMIQRMKRLADYAAKKGFDTLQFENLGTIREPGSYLADALQLEEDLMGAEIPWQLCLDVGHPVALSDRDPDTKHLATPQEALAAWLTAPWKTTPVLQLQQSEVGADQHAPFTATDPQIGGVDAQTILDAVREWDADAVWMFLEMIPSPEAFDDQVLQELVDSATYFRSAVSNQPTA